MTAQLLNSELTNLIQESKRKHADLRNAAEKSLEDLKSLRSTTESQIAEDLSQRPHFVDPFLIACGTRNVKFTGIAVVCLQRLVIARALPRPRLREILEAFQEATSAGLDVQLKILQALPSLFQNYSKDISGELLAASLNICSQLQASKNGIVNNTAAATLQQLVVAIFDKVVVEDRKSLEIPTTAEAPGEHAKVQVRAAAYDAYRVFNDLCLLAESQKPLFLRIASLPQTFGLELVESVLTNHADIFLSHPEQANILRIRLMPFIINSVSGKLSFAITVRIVRILYTLLKRHINILISESEVALGLLTHLLDPETPLWKRALCMEVFRGLFVEGALVRRIFAVYDASEGRKTVIGDIMATFVRLSTEKPSVIGLGQQSSLPSGNPYTSASSSNDQAILEASGIPGIISSSVSSSDATVGVSTQWSSMRTPCIDQLDKTDPPVIPESYIYGLALTCINSFSEGLAKFILPLTVPSDVRNRKKAIRSSEPGVDVVAPNSESKPLETASTDYRLDPDRSGSFKKNPVPLNPLTLKESSFNNDVKICASIVDSCWPAILATCSTFLYSALDVEYYHGLVRSFQKFTHIAGLLRLSTPRDAFLTTLGKAAIPPNIFSGISIPIASPTSPTSDGGGLFNNARGLLSVDSVVTNPTAGSETGRSPMTDSSSQYLNTRNLLCLRALLNLGIALGPTLDDAWSIVLETLQQADFVLFSSNRRTGRSTTTGNSKVENVSQSEGNALLANFGIEIKAVETAASRLFESTIDFPNESFIDVVRALCNLFGREVLLNQSETVLAPTPTSPTARKPSGHRRFHSILAMTPTQHQEDFFALAKLGDVATINIMRLMASGPNETGWTLLTSSLISVATNSTTASPVRLRAAEALIHIVLEAVAVSMQAEKEALSSIQLRLLSALQGCLNELGKAGRESSVAIAATDIDIHKSILDGLKTFLDKCGETLITGWNIVFEIIGSIFISTPQSALDDLTKQHTRTRSPRLVRPSFASLQLICTDFLSYVPSSCSLVLVDALYKFCTQDGDLNISLTTVTFFWVFSDFIARKSDSFLASGLIKVEDSQHLVEKASGPDGITSNAALWMLLLLRLTSVTTDERLELRNSAVQTLLRIFDAYGDQLDSEAWLMCLQSVIFKMLSSVENQLESSVESLVQEKQAWIETAIIILGGVSSLLSTYLHVLISHPQFAKCWQTLLNHFANLLEFEVLEINTAVFKALRLILANATSKNKVENQSYLDERSIEQVWNLWSQELLLVASETSSTKSDNQDCLIAYVAALKEVFRLMEPYIDTKRIQHVLKLLRDTVQRASVMAYSADIEYLTPLQTQVLESLSIVRTDISGVPAVMVKQAADFVGLAYLQDSSIKIDLHKPTYVAFSKASMVLLESLILTHSSDPEIYDRGALTEALLALSKPITAKYKFPIKTKSLAPWRQATTSVLAILKACLPFIKTSTVSEDSLKSIWSAIVQVSIGISTADFSSTVEKSSIASDQDFDITSFLEIRDLITPALGNPSIPDKTRRTYTESLFYTSFVHILKDREIPKIPHELFASLYQPRRGCTVDAPQSPRAKMAYVVFDELVALVSLTDSSPARVKLAQAAAPYLIIRAGLTLKTYLADQPLRGLMPQPLSQRKELLHVLKSLVALRCEPEAIPDTPGVESENKKHLHRLYPLLAKGVRVAFRDQEIAEWMGKALDEVGVEFGV